MVQIYEKTKRMTDLLKNWQESDHPEVSIIIHSLSSYEFKTQGGSEFLTIMLRAILKLLGTADIEKIENISLRELDYFLRDQNTVSVFKDMQQAQISFNKAKSLLLEQIALSFAKQPQDSSHQLAKQFIAYNAALKSFLLDQDLSSESCELVDIEDGLVIVKLREELDNSRNWLEEISESMVKLFQDDEINVIPE